MVWAPRWSVALVWFQVFFALRLLVRELLASKIFNKMRSIILHYLFYIKFLIFFYIWMKILAHLTDAVPLFNSTLFLPEKQKIFFQSNHEISKALPFVPQFTDKKIWTSISWRNPSGRWTRKNHCKSKKEFNVKIHTRDPKIHARFFLPQSRFLLFIIEKFQSSKDWKFPWGKKSLQ